MGCSQTCPKFDISDSLLFQKVLKKRQLGSWTNGWPNCLDGRFVVHPTITRMHRALSDPQLKHTTTGLWLRARSVGSCEKKKWFSKRANSTLTFAYRHQRPGLHPPRCVYQKDGKTYFALEVVSALAFLFRSKKPTFPPSVRCRKDGFAEARNRKKT